MLADVLDELELLTEGGEVKPCKRCGCEYGDCLNGPTFEYRGIPIVVCGKAEDVYFIERGPMSNLHKKLTPRDILSEYQWKGKDLKDCTKEELLEAMKEALTRIEKKEAPDPDYLRDILNKKKTDPYVNPYQPIRWSLCAKEPTHE